MKTRLRFVLLLLAMGVSFSFLAQVPNRGCGSGILPAQFESWVQSITPEASAGQNQTQSVFNIPVIVHVIHPNSPVNFIGSPTGDNLNAAQIQDQINILNRDFNGLNPDTTLIPSVFKPLHGKFQFNFCLAVVNPTGGILAEPGIDRVNANAMGWSAAPYSQSYVNSTIKPATIWDPTRYMNMWVCNLGSGLLGFATFPNPATSGLGGLSGPYGSLTTDGLVMRNTAFGSIGTAITGAPYNKGRTATHEIGHWLGLRHIWGDNGQCGGSDFCNDTPPQKGGTSSPAGANYGCPVFPLNANTCTLSGVANVNGDMFMNFMDYTDDACMYMFTNDQKNRAQLIMTHSPMRLTLLTSTVCNLPGTINDLGVLFVVGPTYSQVINCSGVINPTVSIHNFGTNTITSATFSYNIDGVNTQTVPWTGILPPNTSAAISLPQISGILNGPHVYNLGATSPNGMSDPNMINNSNSQYFTVTGVSVLSISGATSVCAGSSTTLTASGSAGGYTWSPGSFSGPNLVLAPMSAAVYTLSGGTGTCVNTRTVMISVTDLALSATSSLVCGTGTATLNASGASSYTWSNSSQLPSIQVSPSVTTTYSVTAEGPGGACTMTSAVTITVAAVPVLSLSSNPPVVCAGGSATLTVSGASAYSWSPGGNGSSLVVNPSVNTVYTVSGSNSGCVGTQTIQVSVSTGSIALSVSASASAICPGASVALAAGGASTYTWSTGSASANIIVNPTVTTVYSVDGSIGACLSSTVITITVVTPEAFTLSVLPASQTVCAGQSATLTASGTPVSYVWSGLSSTAASVVVTPTANSSYTVSGLGSTPGCVSSSVVTLYFGDNPMSVISTSNSACSNPCTGMVSATTTGGMAPYTYNLGPVMPTLLPRTNLCPGYYTMYTTDANGCSSFNIFSISNFAANFMSSLSYTHSSCGTCGDGFLKVNTVSGVPPFTYQWLPSGGNAAVTGSLSPGCYTVVVSDSVGCMSSVAGCVSIVGIQESQRAAMQFAVYPNPAKERVTISAEGELFDFTLYSHLGQLLVSQKNNRGSVVVNLQGLPAGIYLVELANEKGKAHKKLMVE